jgi:hypothetical protein
MIQHYFKCVKKKLQICTIKGAATVSTTPMEIVKRISKECFFQFLYRHSSSTEYTIIPHTLLGGSLQFFSGFLAACHSFCMFIFLFTIRTFIQTFIHYIRRGPSPYLHSCGLSGRNLPGVPSRDLNSGQAYSKPAHCLLSTDTGLPTTAAKLPQHCLHLWQIYHCRSGKDVTAAVNK